MALKMHLPNDFLKGPLAFRARCEALLGDSHYFLQLFV